MKWRIYPLFVVNGFQNEIHAATLDSRGHLHVFRAFFGAGGFLFILAGNHSDSHSVFEPVGGHAEGGSITGALTGER